jgi:hypothetical protein
MNTFHWPKVEGSSWVLAGFIFISLILHSAAFFLFHATVPIRPPAPKTALPVQLLTPLGPDGNPSAENIALLQWIASADPALVARVPDALPLNLMDVPYQPSYAAMRTAPLGVPDVPETVQFPSAREPLALIMSHGPSTAPAASPLPGQQTRIRFSSSLAKRAPSPNYSPAARAPKAVEPTRLLIGVNADGDVQFAYPQQPSSGSAVLDADALAYAQDLHFAPAPGAPLAWGFVTFAWGDDAVILSSQ